MVMGKSSHCVCEGSAFEDLIQGLTRWCQCGMVNRKMIRYLFD